MSTSIKQLIQGISSEGVNIITGKVISVSPLLIETQNDEKLIIRSAVVPDYFSKRNVKLSGKGLSTNDYNDESKEKVDAIPDKPKYTDTVYDDTKLKGMISGVWSSKVDYAVGTYVTYENKLYRCIRACTAVIPTTTTYWLRIILTDEIITVKDDIKKLNSRSNVVKLTDYFAASDLSGNYYTKTINISSYGTGTPGAVVCWRGKATMMEYVGNITCAATSSVLTVYAKKLATSQSTFPFTAILVY